jgi:polysaccharide export outer membrane protein
MAGVIGIIVALVLGLAPMPVAQVAGQTPPPQSSQDYVLSPGDSVDVSVFGEPTVSRTVVIRPDGKITLPLIGDIDAAGLTPPQLAERITTALKVYLKSPQVSVTVAGVQRPQVFLAGAVTRPGAVDIQRGWTLFEVFAVAGGVTPRAALRRATLTRRATGQVIALDLDRLLIKGDRTADIPVEPGDIIMVPALQNRILVLGAVRSPGPYDVDEGSRFIDVIAMAGGPESRAGTNSIGIIRNLPEGKATVTPVDMNRILRGDMSQNVVLQHQDIVYVPPGPLVRWTDVLAWLSGLALVRTVFGF